ncbi:beta-1,6-N-acetylglucosaminyltransferase [Christiangramia aquimixticola]|uniref:beta-1,6-N-acetylglucosaminyltransferase n=1 Tax=Christiangramia aquimixticola TaxID=1697558 RepID=UPI003AA8B83C
MSKLKIAYLITAFGNYEHLKKLISALNDGTHVRFYIHIDKKSTMPANLAGDNIRFIKRRKVWWGGWSHMAAILDLMENSLEFNSDYHILLSGADYPIRPNYFLYEQLKQGGEFINLIKGFHSHKPEDRIKYYYFDAFDRRDTGSRRTQIFRKLEKFLSKFLIKRKYPFKAIYHGSTWWALTSNTVIYILDELKANPELLKFFKSSWCPEESLIPTIIGNSDIKNHCRNNITFTDWSVKPAPAKINEFHLEMFRDKVEFTNLYGSYKPFFARKFDNQSANLVLEIDNTLRI